MKKKLVVFPLLMLLLASCNRNLPPDYSSSESPSDTSSVSPSDSSSGVSPAYTVSISVTNNKNEYKVGERFSTDNIVVNASLSDGTTKRLTPSDYTLSIDNSYKFVVGDIGSKAVTVSYDGKTTTFTLTIVEASLTSISVTNSPLIYEVGDVFSKSDLIVEATYSDNTHQSITDFTCSINDGYIFLDQDVGTNQATVTYQGIEKQFNIIVNESVSPGAEIEYIFIATNPSKLDYTVGEAFTLEGLVVKAHYDDSSEVAIPNYTTSISAGYIFENSDIGSSKEVTVEFNTYQTAFNISVSDQSIETKCDLLNDALNTYSINSPFEARNILLDQGYDYVLSEIDNEFFGYDYVNEQIAIYSMNSNHERIARYPATSVGHSVTSYQVEEVSSLAELNEALACIGNELNNYSIIKLTSNIVLNSDSPIVITFGSPVEFDLNDHSISATVNSDIFRINHDHAVVSVVDGEIATYFNNEKVNMGEQLSPACFRANTFKYLSIESVDVDSNARYGYGVIDGLRGNDSAIICIKDCDSFNALTNAVCVQNATYRISGCDIDGIVNINGGNVTIENCSITAIGRHDDATPVDDDYLKGIAEYLYLNRAADYSYYTISATDPIIIFDRRNLGGEFDNPNVTVNNCTLTADYEGNVVLGYGVRYLDLNNDPTKDSTGIVELTNITYVVPSGYEGPYGGYNNA